MCNLRRPAVCAISSAMGSLSAAFKEIWRKVLKMFVCGYTKTVMGSEMEIKTSLLLQCVPPKSPNTTHEPHLPLIRTARGPCKDTGNIFAKREISALPLCCIEPEKKAITFHGPQQDYRGTSSNEAI